VALKAVARRRSTFVGVDGGCQGVKWVGRHLGNSQQYPLMAADGVRRWRTTSRPQETDSIDTGEKHCRQAGPRHSLDHSEEAMKICWVDFLRFGA
jgi:hypothetical protein